MRGYGGNTLAAHVVGAGKSAVFITSVMKKKELGLIRAEDIHFVDVVFFSQRLHNPNNILN